MRRTTSAGWTRREALGLLGMGAAAAALTRRLSRRARSFPKGAIIRTILKDYAPEELAGGATLFHEHMSIAPDFMARWTNSAAETRAANKPWCAAARRTPGRRGGRGRGRRRPRAEGLRRCNPGRSSCRTPS